MLENFFAKKSDPRETALVKKIQAALDAHQEGLPLEDLLQLLHQECLQVQMALEEEEPPEGRLGDMYEQSLLKYQEALFLLGRELEASGELTPETQEQAFELAAEADRLMGDFEFEVSQDAGAES